MRSDNLQFRDLFWNSIGSITYAAVSLLMSVVVINISGKIEGGIFSFGFGTLAHLVYIVSYFGIRPMHIVDIKYRYSFNDYVSFGLKASIIAIACGIFYIFYMYIRENYSIIKVVYLSLLVVHGGIDGFADYFESEFQRVNKLYMGGQSQFARIVAFTFTLILILKFTNSLLYSLIAAIIVELIIFYIFNIFRSKDVFKSAKLPEKGIQTRNLFLEALPLFLIVFLDMLIFSITKFSIDANLGDVVSGFFALLFMPVNAIYLMMNLFMKPYLTPLSNAYYTSKLEYKRLIAKAMIVSVIISLLSIAIAIICSDLYLMIIGFVTGNAYTEFSDIAKKLFITVIVGGCFYSINTPLYFSIVIEKKQRFLVISYIITLIIALVITSLFIKNIGIMGAGYAFLVDMFVLCVGIVITKAFCL